MRILFAIGNLDSGGAEKVVSTLANSFVENGHHVGIVLISSAMRESFYEIGEKVEVIPLLPNNEKISISKKTKLLVKQIKRFNPNILVSF